MTRLLLLAAAALAAAHAGAAEGAELPFVGCPSDGQMGPLEAPRRAARPAPPTGAGTAGLTHYASNDLAVLAPPGWHCVGLYGSNGSVLVVTPVRHAPDVLLQPGTTLTGPAIVLVLRHGGTSGRFAVASAIARLFPEHRAFAEAVAAEDPGFSLPTAAYPADRLSRPAPGEVAFETPPGAVGLGTDGWMAPGPEPVSGLFMLRPEREYELVTLRMRLPAAQASLAPAIVSFVRSTHGASAAGD